ncbi:nuclear transport factor 2 family protein [Mycolicibacterium sp. P1-5]|uniref:nuclear transport factor 2 family protein n=1 Tax=Mycolicibacterium sp. P1-5 TaxID=2024617 RepID=UPI0011EFD640|nr:nuclear transport factor 2 family protein [Mycolicibacterium sp. P1-5]KAA0106174.1 nuclear transport factor 2 family protein [Mycolicibacterium sp. P1-5]
MGDTVSDRSADIQAIRDVVVLYCRGIDRLDFDLVRQAYHPDGVDHHTGFDGTIDEYVSWVSRSLEYLAGTMHLIGNHHVDFVGDDTAISETYLMATHWGKSSTDQRANFTTGARYVDLMERRSGRWAIAERWAVREWTRPDVFVAPEQHGPRGTRDADDPLFVLLKRFGL